MITQLYDHPIVWSPNYMIIQLHDHLINEVCCETERHLFFIVTVCLLVLILAVIWPKLHPQKYVEFQTFKLLCPLFFN